VAESKYIVVEGPIGVGKTSLAIRLAEVLGARTVFERSEDNPFLSNFYQSREIYAFQTQIFFLLNRYQQQKELVQQELFAQNTVSDYLFQRDRIFAQLNLTSDELSLYEKVYQLLNPRVPTPDLVVYLQARIDVLLRRLKKRDRLYERGLSAEYLKEVVEAYNSFFYHYEETPLLVVNSSEIDFVESPTDLADLVKEIRGVKKGVQHYIPLGSK
jgi:deoxyadenosine/deoxycytidine kinase